MKKVILITYNTWEVNYMRKDKALKAAVCLASLGLLLSIPSQSVRAENSVPAEQGVAGITYSLDNYYLSVPEEESETAEKALSTILKNEILSPYKNLGVSIAGNYVNIRKDPTTESEIVGKLYRGCATNILERLDGDWVKIESGDVEGYIASNYLAIGKDAEAMVDEYATKYAIVNATTLNVREKQTTDSKILTQIPKGETYVVVKEYEEWAEILLGNGDDEQGDFTGFIKKEDGNLKLIDIDVEFKYAISIEEENAIRRAQEEAERAEKERKEQLAKEEEARRKAEAAAKKAEEERKAAEKKESSSKKDTSTSSPKPSKSSSDIASLQQDIITYALKFVGNRYVWGGESLTNGADCSGFTWRIYKDFGYSIPRVSKDQAASAGRKVSISDRQPGDLIFYTNGSGSVNHVAMYIGNNRIVHAANSREGIKTSKYNYRDVYRVRRVVK